MTKRCVKCVCFIRLFLLKCEQCEIREYLFHLSFHFFHNNYVKMYGNVAKSERTYLYAWVSEKHYITSFNLKIDRFTTFNLLRHRYVRHV